ncbi:MAG: winged helix DNA-binding protein [Firmicutes bacterium]|jgi:DNA-binding MarR family transcriptional regulator|nr:winged helix DNA-binding protein [Bacillota bacterium]
MKENYRGTATFNSILRTNINEFLRLKLKEYGRSELVPSYGSVLSVVFENGGKVQIKVIYDLIQKRKSTITEMINRLVKLGYLEKEKSEEDKRVTYVVATQKALDFKEDFHEISNELFEKLFKNFSEEEKILFADLIVKAIGNFE